MLGLRPAYTLAALAFAMPSSWPSRRRWSSQDALAGLLAVMRYEREMRERPEGDFLMWEDDV